MKSAVEIEKMIEDWHDGAGRAGEPLHVYLGWSWKEYDDYVRYGDIPEEDDRR